MSHILQRIEVGLNYLEGLFGSMWRLSIIEEDGLTNSVISDLALNLTDELLVLNFIGGGA